MSRERAKQALMNLRLTQENPKALDVGYFQKKRLSKKEKAFEPTKLMEKERKSKDYAKERYYKYLKKTMAPTESEKEVHKMLVNQNTSSKKRKRKEKSVNDDDFGLLDDELL
ncbi:hypothetical protein SJAG_00047 [Schizosaccharomyces japonicus yFS275]|uniref:Uncharacterized protein n=1 Tax=Schizosaccharomyces japonicus (strain yFS275 / FY16936) TaxID=402676 RepID=B6JUS2_SCHJY|nr:hypothetical protein SJAG_00047 [Schizosaccharomyces japonicus yFS275]EEB05055.1 hypothetical protein SJAG_00047 [Schizosaccharomyces japonicus yFS275]